MGRYARLAVAGLGVVSLAAAAGCGDSASGGDGGSEVEVAMLNSGSRSDSSWTQSWYEGAQVAGRRAGATASVRYIDELNSVDALDRAGAAELTQGTKYVIYATSEVPQVITKHAKRFPKAVVCGVELPRESYPDNLCTMYPRFEEGAFLAGAAAALASRTGKVGSVAAFDIPVQNIQMEAYALGARYVNPKIRVQRSLTQSLTDPGAARAATTALLSRGVDVVLSGVDNGIRGMFTAAEAHDGLIIAQYVDQYEDSPSTVLTSVMYHMDDIGAKVIDLAVKGDLQPKSYEFSLSELAPFRGETGKRLDAKARATLADVRRRLRGGEINLPPIDVLAKRGAGDKVDLTTLGA